MLKLTHSLISSLGYAISEDAAEDSFDKFLSYLRREPQERTPAMQLGVDFENAVTFYAKHGYVEHGMTEPDMVAVSLFGSRLRGSAPQVPAQKPVTIGGIDYLLVGVADYVKAGIIYDTKRVQRYEYGKYFASSQHPMYFELFPMVNKFHYLIFNGTDTFAESYNRADTAPIETHIVKFAEAVKDLGLWETYKEFWEVK